MSVITHDQYETALRDWLGDRVIFLSGWRTLDSAGGFDPNGIMHHWTAMGAHISPAAQNRILQQGHEHLPGPLSHLAPARDGLVYVTAGPRANCNHAGDGDAHVFERVRAGEFDGFPAPRLDSLDGNPRFYALEYHYHPDDGPMPDEQVEGGILAAAAICQAHGWDATPDLAAGSNLDHFEWTPRKIDRDRDGLADRTRAGVAAVIRQATPTQEADVTIDEDALVEKIKRGILDSKTPNDPGTSLAIKVEQTHKLALQNRDALKRIEELLAGKA